MRFRFAIVLFSFAIAVAGLPQSTRAESMAAAAALNVRTGPGLDYAIADTLFSGERVMVGNCRNDWCHVTHSGPDGWVYKPLLIPGITTTTIEVASRQATDEVNDLTAQQLGDISVILDLTAPYPCQRGRSC